MRALAFAEVSFDRGFPFRLRQVTGYGFVGMQLLGMLPVLDGLIKASGIVVGQPENLQGFGGLRRDLRGVLGLGHCLAVLPAIQQHDGVPLQQTGILGLELDTAFHVFSRRLAFAVFVGITRSEEVGCRRLGGDALGLDIVQRSFVDAVEADDMGGESSGVGATQLRSSR